MALPVNCSRSRGRATGRYVALVRGVNVGGKSVLPMSELVKVFTAAGCAQVQTYIQSGNVVFAATPACAARLAGAVSDAIEARFGFRPAVILRTPDELADVAAGNPFLRRRAASPDVDADVKTLHVAFLADRPDARRAANLNPARSPGDEFHLQGREVYLRYAAGAGKTKLTNDYFESVLGTPSTLRNWRTVLKLAEMSDAPS